jgi:hypothetical protein
MIRILLSAALLTACATASSAQQEPVEQTLIALERQSWVAWQQHDGAYFERFLADDHVEVHGTGVLRDPHGVAAHVASPACVVRSYSLDQFQFTQFDADTALLTYRAAQDTDCGAFHVPSPVWVTSLYELRDGEWRNALYIHTPIPHG